MAPGRGFEPLFTGSKPAVLPLNDPGSVALTVAARVPDSGHPAAARPAGRPPTQRASGRRYAGSVHGPMGSLIKKRRKRMRKKKHKKMLRRTRHQRRK